MYVYQNEEQNFIVFSSFHNEELKECLDSIVNRFMTLKDKINNELPYAKMILANNDTDSTSINGLQYTYVDYNQDESYYSVEYNDMEISCFSDKMIFSMWAEAKDGFHVYVSFSLDIVSKQFILYEIGTEV